MKRTALKRRTPLARGTSKLARTGFMSRSPMKRKRRRARPEGHSEPKRLAWIRTLPCCAPGCAARAPSEAHHHSLYGAGMACKAPDNAAMPLCTPHHVPGLHALAGPFKGWTRAQLTEWQDTMIEFYRYRYAREPAA